MEEKILEMPDELENLKGDESIALLDEKEEIRDEKEESILLAPKVQKDKCLGKNSEFSAIYDYTDEKGKTVFQIVKTINGRQPYYGRIPSGNGDYEYKIPRDLKLVPYNLPSINKAIKEETPIWLVEGESKADTINKLGFIATTVAFKSAYKFTEEYAEFFQGAKAIIIIADNDERGEDFAEHSKEVIKGTLEDTEVATIRVNEICSNIKSGGDIDDLIELFGEDSIKATLETIESQF